jgi:hypothetical protein
LSIHRVASTCAAPHLRVYSEHYSAYAGCASARPPGADTRRPPPPPPWRGSSLFSDKIVNLSLRRPMPSSCVCAARPAARFVHRRESIHISQFGHGGASDLGHTVGA